MINQGCKQSFTLAKQPRISFRAFTNLFVTFAAFYGQIDKKIYPDKLFQFMKPTFYFTICIMCIKNNIFCFCAFAKQTYTSRLKKEKYIQTALPQPTSRGCFYRHVFTFFLTRSINSLLVQCFGCIFCTSNGHLAMLLNKLIQPLQLKQAKVHSASTSLLRGLSTVAYLQYWVGQTRTNYYQKSSAGTAFGFYLYSVSH